MSESQEGDAPQVPQVGIHHPKAVAARFPPGVSGNPGGIEKASGLPASTLRARLGQKLKDDQARAERILERRLYLAETAEDHGTIDDLFDQIEGKLEKSTRNLGEPTVVVINGPKAVAAPPESP